MEHGKGDGIFITTSGVGLVFADPLPDPRAVRPGDLVMISGPIGLHGMAIMSVREGLAFESELASDSAPLGDLVASVYRAGARPRCLRDPTRGGVAATLAEIAQASQTGIVLEENAIPVPEMVKGACEILGLDPLLVANEGLMLFVVSPKDEAVALQALRAHPLRSRGRDDRPGPGRRAGLRPGPHRPGQHIRPRYSRRRGAAANMLSWNCRDTLDGRAGSIHRAIRDRARSRSCAMVDDAREEDTSMRFSMLLAWFLILTATASVPASGKGKGGGQGHASRPHAASPPRSHPHTFTRSQSPHAKRHPPHPRQAPCRRAAQTAGRSNRPAP